MLQAFRNFMSRRTMSANLRNRAMNTFSSYKIFEETRIKSETSRQQENRPHEVLYFHKVDDPYSHLTIQYIDKFKSSFDVTFKPVLVGEEDPEMVHEPSLYSVYCLEDVKKIAPFYGIKFSADFYPSKELVTKANSILTSVAVSYTHLTLPTIYSV